MIPAYVPTVDLLLWYIWYLVPAATQAVPEPMVPRTLYASLPYGRPTVTDLWWLMAVPPYRLRPMAVRIWYLLTISDNRPAKS